MEKKKICKNCKKCIGNESDPEGLWCVGKIKGPTGDYCLYMQIDTFKGIFYAPSHEFTYMGKNYNCE